MASPPVRAPFKHLSSAPTRARARDPLAVYQDAAVEDHKFDVDGRTV
jgi:hypothetical protein